MNIQEVVHKYFDRRNRENEMVNQCQIFACGKLELTIKLYNRVVNLIFCSRFSHRIPNKDYKT